MSERDSQGESPQVKATTVHNTGLHTGCAQARIIRVNTRHSRSGSTAMLHLNKVNTKAPTNIRLIP